ncbi:hypothetical protein [Empedobacter falsenii]
MSEVLLILSGLIYSICFGIFMISWAKKDLYYISSVFSYIPFISGVILPVISYSIVLEWNWVIIFLIHIGFLFFLAKRLTDEYLVRFASGKGLGNDYILSFVLATIFMTVGILIKYQLSYVGNFIIVFIVFGFVYFTIILNKNTLSETNILEEYRDLMAELLSHPKMEIISNSAGKAVIGYSFLGGGYVNIVVKEKKYELIITYKSNDLVDGTRSKTWVFHNKKNQRDIFKEVSIGLLVLNGASYQDAKEQVYRTEYKGEKIIRRYNDLICYLDGIFDIKIIENLPDLVKIISVSENNFEKIEIIICIKDEMLVIIYDSKNEYYGSRHFIKKYSLDHNQFSIYKDIAKLIIDNDNIIKIQHIEDPLKNFLKTDLQRHIQKIILKVNLFAFGGKARLIHINENEFNLHSEGKYFAKFKLINHNLTVHWTFFFNGEVYNFDIQLGIVMAVDEETLLSHGTYHLFIMTKEQLFKIIDEADDGSAYGISIIEDAAERDFL